MEVCERLYPESPDKKDFCGGLDAERVAVGDKELRRLIDSKFLSHLKAASASGSLDQKLDYADELLRRNFSSPRLRLKGLYPGIRMDEAETLHPGLTKWCADSDRTPGNDAPKTCYIPSFGREGDDFEFRYLATLAEEPVTSWLLWIVNKKIWKIQVSMSSASTVRVCQALSAKYKGGSSTNQVVQNGFGAKLQNPIVRWRDGRLELGCQKYAGSTEDGGLYFLSEVAPNLEQPKKTRDL